MARLIMLNDADMVRGRRRAQLRDDTNQQAWRNHLRCALLPEYLSTLGDILQRHAANNLRLSSRTRTAGEPTNLTVGKPHHALRPVQSAHHHHLHTRRTMSTRDALWHYFTQRLRELHRTDSARTRTPHAIWRLWAAINHKYRVHAFARAFRFPRATIIRLRQSGRGQQFDEPVELNRQPRCRLAGGLRRTASQQRLDCDRTLTDTDDARNGLRQRQLCHYDHASDFSKRIAVDTMQVVSHLTGTPAMFSTVWVRMETSSTTGVNDPQFARAAARREKQSGSN